jgi:hypothetical protein
LPPTKGYVVNRLWSRLAVRVTSVGLLVVGAIGGVYLGQDRLVEQQSGTDARLAVRADAEDMRLLKVRQNEHAVARAWQRQAESDAAAKAARAARTTATRAHALEKAAEEKAEEKKAKSESSGALVPYTGRIPTSCKEYSGNRSTGCALMLDAGFEIDQFPCLNNLWNSESGWNARATNSGSGAYGIPQAYPGSKMASVAADWKTNPATQIKWGLGYIKGKYKSPCGAWGHFQDAGGPGVTGAGPLRRGFLLEYATLGWNVIGIVVLAAAAWAARSVALAGFGLDSLIEIGASIVVIWELSGTGEDRQRRALRLIGAAFAGLAVFLAVQATVVLATGFHPRHSPAGIAWTALTAGAMFALAAGKARVGRALDNPVLRAEGRVTLIDGLLAAAVLAGLLLNAGLGWWWADPAAGYVLVYYAAREVRHIVRHS